MLLVRNESLTFIYDININKKTFRIIPAEMGYLTELTVLDLNGNSLQGVLPTLMFRKLKKLKMLNLHMNDLFGAIPKEIGLLKNLKELTLFGNFFFGKVPTEIANLKKLGKILFQSKRKVIYDTLELSLFFLFFIYSFKSIFFSSSSSRKS